jgi:hypothetical protein
LRTIYALAACGKGFIVRDTAKTVIAGDKREAFAQGSPCDEAIQLPFGKTKRESWIASRSLSSGARRVRAYN